MPEESTPGQAPETTVDDAPETGAPDTTTQDDDEFDRDRAMATITELRKIEKAAKKQSKELDELRTKLQAQEDAEKDELTKAKEAAERAQSERDAALRTANDRLIKAEVKMLASDPEISIVPQAVDDAYLLMAKDDIEVHDDGNVSGVKDALKALVEAKPWLRVSDQQPRPVPASPRPAGQQSRQEIIASEREKLLRSGQYGI